MVNKPKNNTMSASTSPPAYTLTYFDARGLAEVTRYLFAISETPYTDKRLPLQFKVPGDFSTIVKEEFDAAKKRGDFRVGMDRVPVLDVDGVRIAQSKAIERFVARRVLERAQPMLLHETQGAARARGGAEGAVDGHGQRDEP